MQLLGGQLIFSATDLSSFVACGHLAGLRHRQAQGAVSAPELNDPSVDAWRRRGDEHVKACLRAFYAAGLTVEEVSAPEPRSLTDLERHANLTLAAMQRGVDVIYQGALFDGTWFGQPDFLRKVARPSALGDYSYEVIEAKLARKGNSVALLQMLLFADLLEGTQGGVVERGALALAGPGARTEYFRVADYVAYYRTMKDRFLAYLQQLPTQLPAAPDLVEHCGECAWSSVCRAERVKVDHLSRVAGISRSDIAALRANGVHTLARLASTQARPADIAPPTFARIQGQARLQLIAQVRKQNVHELLTPIIEGHGLSALPAPDEGDLYFDVESDPNAFVRGIHYLFGYSDRRGEYTGTLALTPEQEREAFEPFIDFLLARRRQYPNMHVYHYTTKETIALKQLKSRHSTREAALNELMRAGVFIDLQRVVKQSLRASVESYSLETLEPCYGFRRNLSWAHAKKAVTQFELWLEFGEDSHDVDVLEDMIRVTNLDDCDSMLFLQKWLEELRDRLVASGTAVPRPATPLYEEVAPAPRVSRSREAVGAL